MRRSGYTMFEIVLVMAVLVIIGAVCVPFMKPMLASNDVQAATDMVRSRWTEMRTRAMTEGRAYRFAIEENTGKFRIAPDDGQYWGDSNSSSSSGSDQPAWVVEETLPGQVVFMNGGAVSHDNTSSGGSGPWTLSFTILPDGKARQDVRVSFGRGGAPALVLKLHGGTGAVVAEDADPQGNRS
jgi:type II secretory pathway pseudopilin PulG